MQKQIAILAMSKILLAPPAHSQSIAGSEGKFTITPSFVTTYMDRGLRQSGFSFQPTIEYSKGPLTLGIFGSFPISEKIPGTADPELNFYSSYAWEIVSDVFRIEPGITINEFPGADSGDGAFKTTYEPSLTLGYTISDINLSLALYYDINMDCATYEFGIDYSIPLKRFGTELCLSGLAGKTDCADSVNHSIPKVHSRGSYYEAGITVPYEFSKNSKLIIGWHYHKGVNAYSLTPGYPKEPDPNAIGRGFLQVAFSLSF